jgi:hypothetical protein
MNISLVTSFVVGGLLLLSMLTLNNMVMLESSKSTIDMSNKVYVDNLREIITNDLNRIGYGNNAKINSISDEKIVFTADVFGNGLQEITWEFKDDSEVLSTTNQNDYILLRKGPIDASNSIEEIEYRVVDFKITAFKDKEGKMQTYDKSEVKSVKIELIYESPEPLGRGSGTYYRSVWRKHFVPNNIQFQDLNS